MQVDYQNLLSLLYGRTATQIFKSKDLAVIRELIKYQDYYDNKAFNYIEVTNKEYRANNIKDYNPTKIPINFSRKIINKLSSWQFGNGFEFNVTTGSTAQGEELQAWLYDLKEDCKLEYKMLQAAKECNISGGVAIKMLHKEPQGIYFVLSPRLECWPVTDFDNIDDVQKVNFIAWKDEKTIWKQTFEMRDGYCYYFEADYDSDKIDKPKVIIQEGFLGTATNKIPFLPVYIIPNQPDLGEVWGNSELHDLLPIIDEVMKKYSDSSDALKFEMFAITILMNIANLDDKNIQTHAGALWELMGQPDKEPKVTKLESQFAYTESLKTHLDNCERLIYELAEVVKLDSDSVQNLGNLSGVALKLLFANMMAKLDQKNIVWTDVLESMFKQAAEMNNIYSSKKVPLPDDLKLEVTINTKIPTNEMEEVTIEATKVTSNLSSVTSAMDKLGVEDSEAEYDKMLEEKKNLVNETNPYSGQELQVDQPDEGI